MLKKYCMILALVSTLLLSGCGAQKDQEPDFDMLDPVIVDKTVAVGAVENEPETNEEMEILDKIIPLSAAIPSNLETSAPNILTQSTDKAIIDYSNTDSGYVMIRYVGETSNRLKVLITGPTTTYNYNLTPGIWETFPLSDGNGNYQIGVYENVVDTKYSTVVSVAIDVHLKDEFSTFLYSNQYVNYENAPNAVALAQSLTAGKATALEKVYAIYDYVVTNLTYDYEKAANMQTEYLPDLDQIIEAKTGICFDYASLMTGMLRSQGIPCKLVVGYAGTTYHAWISVWTEEEGWINGAIYFDGTNWQRMDPTFASTSHQSNAIMSYIGDNSNYIEKYLY